MAIKSEEILDFLFGEEGKNVDSLDKVKEKFTGEKAVFVPVSELNDSKSEVFKRFVPRAVGTISGKTVSIVKKKASELGIELTSEEIKDKPVEEVVDYALSKISTTVSTKLTDYESKLKQNTDERVAALSAENATYKQKYSDLDNLHQSLKKTYETDTANAKNQLRNFKLDSIKSKKHSDSLKFAATTKELEKEGFFAKISKKYKLDLNEAENDLEVFDASTNARIPNPKQAGAFMTYEDILEAEGREAGIWSVNSGAKNINQNQNKNSIFTPPGQGAQPNEGTPQPGRKVSSRVRSAGTV